MLVRPSPRLESPRVPRGLPRAIPVAACLALTLLSCDAGGEADRHDAGAAKALRQPAGAARGMNVLLVTFDTVRADALSCYGEKRIQTPTVDSLAANGVRFERALAPTPITLPSHATLFTGLDPLSHGVRNNGTFKLASEHVTLPETLAAQGYDTAAVVAAFVLDKRYGVDQGFASYDDEVHVDGQAPSEGHFRERNATQVTDRALEWLDHHQANRGADPFFLWTHYFDAHAPYQAPAEHVIPGLNTDPNAPFDYAVLRGRYLSEVAYADAELGRLLEGLGPERRANTLIVFTADHGEGLGEHGEFTHSRLIYDSTMRVPLIISSPKLFRGSLVVSDRVVGLVDVAPTLLSLLGIAAPKAVDGKALFADTLEPERTIYGESLVTLFNHGWAPLHSLSRVADKHIRAPRAEYYDIVRDPGELENLFGARGDRSAPLVAALDARLKGASAAVPREPELDSEIAKGLAALGYSRSTASQSGAGAIDPKDAIVTWAVLTNARGFSAQGQHERALADVRRVIDFNPADPFAWETLYVVRERRGMLTEAEAALRKLLELHPTSEAAVRLAWLLYKQSKFSECERIVAWAESLEPEHGDIHLIRAEIAYHERRYDEALREFERALAADPGRVAERARKGIESAQSALRGAK